MEPFYLLHFTYGMDYTRKGVFTPGKYGEWRFDKRTYAQLPPPRHLSEPPRGMRNALVCVRDKRRNGGRAAPSCLHLNAPAGVCAGWLTASSLSMPRAGTAPGTCHQRSVDRHTRLGW